MFFRKKYTDQEVVNGLLAYDSSIYSFLDKEYRHLVNSIVLNNSGTIEDAEEHYTDVLMLVLKNTKEGKFDFNRGKFKAYFRTITSGLWIDKLRKRKKRIKSDVLEEWQINSLKFNVITLEDELQLKLEKLLTECMKQLSEDDQQLLKLRYYKNQPFKVIESTMNYKSGYSRVKLDRIKKQLKKMMTECVDPEVQFFLETTKS